MKKFVKAVIVLTLTFIFSPTVFSACSPSKVEIRVVRCDLNGGSFTEEYKTEKGITSDNLLKAVNLNYYGGFSDGLPDERAFIAPSGKVFAGWYLDKECTSGKYLTSQNWENLVNGIRENNGKNVIYARWIDIGTKDILYEIVSDEVTFSEDFISKNTIKANMTGKTIVRFNVSKSDFETEKNNLPTSDDMIVPIRNEFGGWKVECNGHYYDFKQKEYNPNANNKLDFVNHDFDYETFSDFWADGNENVAYILFRPKVLQIKSVNKITISLDNVYIDISEYDKIIDSKRNEFNVAPGFSSDYYIEIDGKPYYTGVSFEIRYDIDFAFIESVLPTTCLIFNNGLEYDGWKFKISDTEYEFTEANWNLYAKTKPSETERNVQFILKTK